MEEFDASAKFDNGFKVHEFMNRLVIAMTTDIESAKALAISTVKTTYDKKTNDMSDDHNQKIKNLKESYDHRLSEVTDDYDKQLADQKPYP